MGFIKGAVKVMHELVTLGGASLLEKAKADYQISYEEYEKWEINCKRLKSSIDQETISIGLALKEAKKSLDAAERIIKKSIDSKDQLAFEITFSTLEGVNKFNGDFNSVLNVASGTVAGGSLALGSWALVGAIGTASTGTAISTLSGVAATNATLAWFGGGSLAAGGAGMSGGMAVLGGIAVLPVVYFATKGAYKKAKEFQEEREKLDEIISKQKVNHQLLSKTLGEVERIRMEMQSHCSSFIAETAHLIKIVRPHGFFSAMKQAVKKILGKKSFTDEQSTALVQLNDTISKFLSAFKINTHLVIKAEEIEQSTKSERSIQLQAASKGASLSNRS